MLRHARPLFVSLAGLAALPAVAVAGPPTVTVETDLGSRDAAPFASCVFTRTPAPMPSDPSVPSTLCSDGAPGSSPRLALSPGSVVTFRSSQPLVPEALSLIDEHHHSIPGLPPVMMEAGPDGSVRFTLPASAPALTFAFLSLQWDDGVSYGNTSFGVGLVVSAPPTPPIPAPTTPSRASAAGPLRLIALERTQKGAAALTVRAPLAGQLRITWGSGAKRRSKELFVPAGRQVVSLALPRTVRRVQLRARLLAAAGESRRTARSLRVEPAAP